ncbi:VanZ family protein [Radiobacillus sp. PE A8.2]|uniref:VanZ family protein n=1 Tax=Radiobacillus sp. PE A8.2 TaxID=3380349 RepID=UPI00388E1AAC
MRIPTPKMFSWFAVIVWMAIIFYLSAQVADTSNQLSSGITEVIVRLIEKVSTKLDLSNFNFFVRKTAHFTAYMVLGILVIHAMRNSTGITYRSIVISLSICILYAISDELHQMFVPGRGPAVWDVCIDSAGAIVGIGLYFILWRITKKSYFR